MGKTFLTIILTTLLTFSSFISFSENNTLHCDICIYGESAAGVVAAIQGARMAKSVVLLSKNHHVGGMVTSGLTATDMNRNDLVGGITKEFYHNIYNYYLDPQVWRCQDRASFMQSTLKRTYTGKNEERKIQWVYESSVAEKIMLDMLAGAGVKVLFNHRLDLDKQVIKEENRIVEIHLDNGIAVRAKIYIDASYEGDLMAQSGVSYILGREANHQYGETLNGIRINYNGKKNGLGIDPYLKEGKPKSGLLPYIDNKPWGAQGDADTRVQAYCFRMTLTNDSVNRIPIQKPHDYNSLWYEVLARQLKKKPETILQQIITLTPMPNKKTDTNHLDFTGASYDYPEANYEKRYQIEQLHRSYALGKLWFLCHDPRVPEHIRKEMTEWGLSEDEFRENGNFPYQIYIREARRMIGLFVMTEKNVRKSNRMQAENSVGLGSYAMDCHFVSNVIDQDESLRNEGSIFTPVTPYPINYHSITPREEECSNLLVPVCVSASHVAYSSLRMEPVYMILGQSAATAASIAIDENVSVQKVPYGLLGHYLIKDGQNISLPGKGK